MQRKHESQFLKSVASSWYYKILKFNVETKQTKKVPGESFAKECCPIIKSSNWNLVLLCI